MKTAKTLGMIVVGLALGLTSCNKNPEYTLVKDKNQFVEHYLASFNGMNSDSTFSVTQKNYFAQTDTYPASTDGVYFGGRIKYAVTSVSPETLKLKYVGLVDKK